MPSTDYLGAHGEARRQAENAQLVLDAVTIQTLRYAQMLADKRGPQLSTRALAGRLGIGKSKVAALLNGSHAESLSKAVTGEGWPLDVTQAVGRIWQNVAGMTGWVSRSGVFSYALMGEHGIPNDGGLGGVTPDIPAFEIQELSTGTRWLLYSQTRWNGRPLGEHQGYDGQGAYILETCPGRADGCVDHHQPLALDSAGLSADDLTFGDGWRPHRPSDSQVFAEVSAALVARTGAVDVEAIAADVFGAHFALS